MLPRPVLAAGALGVGALIIATQALALPAMLHYVWGALVLLWGVFLAMPAKDAAAQ